MRKKNKQVALHSLGKSYIFNIEMRLVVKILKKTMSLNSLKLNPLKNSQFQRKKKRKKR